MIERGGLEIRCTVYPYRGFESLTFRCFIQWDAIIRIPFSISALENLFTTKRLLTRNVSPLMPINCLIKCLINSEQFVNNSWTIRVPKQINGFLMNQFMNINVSKKGPFASLSFWLLVSLTLYLSPIREIRVSKQHTRNTTSWEVGIGERRRQSESRRQVPWELAFTSYCLFPCASPNFSLFKRMNHWMSESISEHYNCVGCMTDCPFALSLQHLAHCYFSTLRVVPSE